MILFFRGRLTNVIAVQTDKKPEPDDIGKLEWLFSDAGMMDTEVVNGTFIGPRKEMITPWSTNAVEITQNMGIKGIQRIEEFIETSQKEPEYDPMLSNIYYSLDQDVFTINIKPDPIFYIDNIQEYNRKEGLALSSDEVKYLEALANKLGRKLTDSEIFGFSQVNSEHCRHKIFNGTFIINGKEHG